MWELVAFVILLLPSPITSTSVNFTVTDADTVVRYTPSSPTSSTAGWNISYSQAPWSSYTSMTIGTGESSHYTNLIGATMSFQFSGYAVYVWGQAGVGAMTITLDESPLSGQDDSLLGYWVAKSGSANDAHTITVQVTADTGVLFNGITYTMEVGTGASDEVFVNSTLPGLTGTSINSAVSVSTSCSAQTTAGSTNAACSRIDCYGLDQPISFSVPSSTSFFTIHGTTAYNHGNYTVALDPAPPNFPATQTFNGMSPFVGLDSIMYAAALDASKDYTVSIENTDWTFVSFESAVFYSVATVQASTATGSTSSSGGTGGRSTSSASQTSPSASGSRAAGASSFGSVTMPASIPVETVTALSNGSTVIETYYTAGTPALSAADLNQSQTGSTSSDSSHSSAGVIVGCVFGILAALGICVGVALYLRRVRRARSPVDDDASFLTTSVTSYPKYIF